MLFKVLFMRPSFMKTWHLFLLLPVIFFYDAKSQEFGGNRFSTTWKQINTDTVRVIFPAGYESGATRIANTVHRLSFQNKIALGNRLKKIDIVLQNTPIIANGYVGMAPFRSEFYMTPPPDNFDLGTLSWGHQLALHEYRHVQQYNNFYRGISKAAYFLLGQQGYALATNAAIPNWFFEGDAVYQETALSPQGRGRMPSFLKAFPSLWMADKKYSWMKLRNGSLKHYVPNHYDLGYLLVNYGNEKYGNDFWRHVTEDASAYEGFFYPMQKAVKEYTGLRYKTFIRNAFDYYKNIYNIDSLRLQNNKVSNIVKSKSNAVTHYFFPAFISQDSLVYTKASYKKLPAFYIKDSTGEHLLRLRDIGIDEHFSYKNGKIVYAAYESHPRWRWLSYSVIKILDIKSGMQKTLQHRTRYFSPDISDDGKYIAANHSLINGGSSLIVLNAFDGAIVKELKIDSIEYFSNPKFLNDSIVAASVRNAKGENELVLININSKAIESLTLPSYNPLGQIDVKNDSIYFIASQGLKDEIICMDIRTKQISKLKTSGIANYYINASDENLVWSEFRANGYQLKQLKKQDARWQPFDKEKLATLTSGILSQNVRAINILDSASQRNFAISKYSKLTKPFNFHSWRPYYEAPEYSLSIFGNNVLNTVESKVYYLFNENDKTHTVGTNLMYGGLFPYIIGGTQFIFNKKDSVAKKLRQWAQWENYLGLSIPLSWASGRTYKAFNLGSKYVYRNEYNKGAYKDSFTAKDFGYLHHYLSWAQQLQTARQHIFPRWGYSFSLQYLHTTNFYQSSLLYSKANLFLPGIFPTHSIVLTGALQERGNKDRVFSSRIPYARGFSMIDSAKVWAVSANYHLPLAYPDWGFANLFYLQRIRANIFYDFTRMSSKSTSSNKDLQSIGSEMYFDTKWWNSYPLSFGVRGGYLLNSNSQSQKFFLELILPVSLIP